MIPKQYIPAVGDTVQLDDYTGYTSRGIPPWGPLYVKAVNGLRTNEHGTRYFEEGKVPQLRLETLDDGELTGLCIDVSPGEVKKPLYWEPQYTIYVKDREQGEQVLSWLREGRGVKVWGSQDLSTAGRTFYTPGDADKPHWSVEGVEIVHDPDRIKVLLVVKHPVPTGEPTGVVHADDWKKAKAEAVKERKRALREHKALGRKVQNIKDGGVVLESWFETYEEIKD